VLSNLEIIQYVESILRTLLFMTPGRYKDSEFKVEAAYTGLGLVSLVHDYLILKFLKKQDSLRKLRVPGLPPTDCIKYAKWLSVLQYSELCIEVAARHKWGTRGKWVAVFVIEVFKSILKLRLLFSLRGHTLVHYHIPQFRDAKYISEIYAQYQQEQSKKLQRTSKREKRIVSTEKWEQFKLQIRSDNDQVSKPFDSPAPAGETFAEILHIVRPIIYLVSMYRYGRQSWRAWIFSLITDVFSLSFYSARRISPLNEIQRQEVAKRSALLVYYLLRSPFFEALTQRTPGPVKTIAGKLGNVPGFHFIFSSLYDFLLVYREHYFYTSAT